MLFKLIHCLFKLSAEKLMEITERSERGLVNMSNKKFLLHYFLISEAGAAVGEVDDAAVAETFSGKDMLQD